jgi:hypothetical protein
MGFHGRCRHNICTGYLAFVSVALRKRNLLAGHAANDEQEQIASYSAHEPTEPDALHETMKERRGSQ